MPDILSLITVFFSFGIVLILPTWILSARINQYHDYAHIALTSLILGFSSQSILGLFWNHFVAAYPQCEVLMYFSGWLILSVMLVLFLPVGPQNNGKKNRGGWFFLLLICAAILLRSIHPLQHMALGQSDAYSHLQFLRNVVEFGSIRHHIYPPGYHWVLLLPVFPFHLEPYDIARFSGAFFGACLVLAVFVLIRELAGHTAAIIAAFFIACFPGFNLLIKTGVGSFANQLGLFYLPAIYYFFYKAFTDSFRNRSVNFLFCFSLAGLAVTVPIMLISVVIVILATIILLRRHNRIKEFNFLPILLMLPALIILCIHIGHAGWLHQRQTISLITDDLKDQRKASNIEEKENLIRPVVPLGKGQEIKKGVALLVVDFFSVKRWGIRDRVLSITGLFFFALFFFFLLRGIFDNRNAYILLGMWGLLTSIQTLTGFAQFSNYQREGWSLMIVAAGCLGIVGGGLFHLSGYKSTLKITFFVLFILSVSWGVMHPPGHFVFASKAEDQIIKIVRAISTVHGKEKIKEISSSDQEVQRIISTLEMNVPIVFVSRRMSGWSESGQGELLGSIVKRRTGLDVVTIGTPGDLEKLKKKMNMQYIFFVDHDVTGDNENIAFANINPIQVDRFLKQRKELQENNRIIESFIKGLDSRVWNIHVVTFDQKLDVYVTKQRSEET